MRTTTFRIIMWLVVVSGLLAIASPVAAQDNQPLIVQLKGKTIGTTRTIPAVPETGTTQGNCFDADLVNVVDNRVIGTATRCLTDIHTVDGGMALTGTTFFRLPQGTIVSRQRTTVQPITDSAAGITHITGAIPPPLANNILTEAGTGKFAGVPGSVRFAGAMDLSNFKDRNEIAFDDIAIIRLAERTAQPRQVERTVQLRPAESTAQLREVQRRLKEDGFYTGPIDGAFGPGTRGALSQYQARHGLPKTGALDDATRRALGVL
jgi:hypothetical protein